MLNHLHQEVHFDYQRDTILHSREQDNRFELVLEVLQKRSMNVVDDDLYSSPRCS